MAKVTLNRNDLKKLILEVLSEIDSFTIEDISSPFALRKKIIITYDAGKEYQEEKQQSAKESIITFLYNQGIRKFHSPTKSTIIFTPNTDNFNNWTERINVLFKSFEKDFYYSISLIPDGQYYQEKPDPKLNKGIITIIKKITSS